jgi:hypothetical protein
MTENTAEEVLLVIGHVGPPNPLREEELAVVLDPRMRVAELKVVDRRAVAAESALLQPRSGRPIRWLLGRGLCPRPEAISARLRRVRYHLARLCDGNGVDADYHRVQDMLSGWSHAELTVLMCAEDVVGDPSLRTKLSEGGDRMLEAQQAARMLRDDGISLVDPEHLDVLWNLTVGEPS